MCLCKTLLVFFFASFPFILVDFTKGWFGSIAIPVLVAFSLLGIDRISTELENPFGQDANDLDLLECVHALESEAMEMLSNACTHSTELENPFGQDAKWVLEF